MVCAGQPSSKEMEANAQTSSETGRQGETADMPVGSKQFLKEAYTPGKRYFELTSVATAVASMAYVLIGLMRYWQFGTPLGVFMSVFGGVMFADFGSGFMHWLCDSYGSVDMPVFGKAFIRSFREHHIDPLAITRHDVVECNGDNCMIVALSLLPFVYMLSFSQESTIARYYNLALFFAFWGIFIAFTNQFHKWAHTHAGLPRWVEFLQKYHIILSKQNHHVHHVTPHATYFCTTTGWLNYPLHKLQFWRGVEFAILKVTGYRARDDDRAWMAKEK